MYKLNRKINNATAYVVADKKRYLTVTGPLAIIAARWLEDQLEEIDGLFSSAQDTKSLKKIAIDYCEINFNSKVFIFDR